MWPWGHLAVAYLCYRVYARRRYGRTPRALPAVALAVGSQAPDLLDKPLAWTAGVLPAGRTLAHSLLFAALALPVVYALARSAGRAEAGVAFVVGHLSHLLADVPPAAFAGDPATAAYLVWPLLPAPEEVAVAGILDAILTYYAMGPFEWLQLGLFALAVAAWVRDGAPGLEYVRLTGLDATGAGR
ncbi:metal-dependent hydrolase [Salinilacihabitans rarus]|uniref:metal-dependent hydrolase n=1 Tax=Salinilacihabitans rarus TaxID=2961596 RepID=UPI0020C84CB3|nr:metal-dependent hydrolase [Salinilacihabitans rarus]